MGDGQVHPDARTTAGVTMMMLRGCKARHVSFSGFASGGVARNYVNALLTCVGGMVCHRSGRPEPWIIMAARGGGGQGGRNFSTADVAVSHVFVCGRPR